MGLNRGSRGVRGWGRYGDGDVAVEAKPAAAQAKPEALCPSFFVATFAWSTRGARLKDWIELVVIGRLGRDAYPYPGSPALTYR